MVIWILDYVSGDCLRIEPLSSTREVISNDYNDNVEDWLNDHEKDLGIRMSDCSFMVVDDDRDCNCILI